MLERRIKNSLTAGRPYPLIFRHQQAGQWLAVPLQRQQAKLVLQISGCILPPGVMWGTGRDGRGVLRGSVVVADIRNISDGQDVVEQAFGVSLQRAMKREKIPPPDKGVVWPTPFWVGRPSCCCLSKVSMPPYLDDAGEYKTPIMMGKTGIDADITIKQYTMPGMTWETYQRYYRRAWLAWRVISQMRK